MKLNALKPTQKKWALTGMLLVALGFNLSAPLRSMSSLDLASEDPGLEESEAEEKSATITLKDGKKHKVVFKQLKGQTLAYGPNSLEGKACDTDACMSYQVLNVSFASDVDELTAAFRKSFQKSAKAEKDPTMKEAADLPAQEEDVALDAEAQRAEERAKRAEALLNRSLRLCERKKEGRAQATCQADEFIKALKSSSNRKGSYGDRKREPLISDEIATDFFNENIRESLLASLSYEEMDLLARPGYGGGMSFGSSGPNGAELLQKLQAKLPKGYNELRKAVKQVALDAVKGFTQQLRFKNEQMGQVKTTANKFMNMANTLNAQASRTQDPQQRQMLLAEAQQARGEADRMNQQLMSMRSDTSLMNKIQTMASAMGNNMSAGLLEAQQQQLITSTFSMELMQDYKLQLPQLYTDSSLLNPVLTSGTTDTFTGQTIQGVLRRDSTVIRQGNQGSITGGPTQQQTPSPVVPFGTQNSGQRGSIQRF
ncbi:MAG: hypothetical protein KF802_06960 [Bdellovibrionaceae bacterium]|nr:hypothetical protein [Pseudobdellovibrionaceae bacterium]